MRPKYVFDNIPDKYSVTVLAVTVALFAAVKLGAVLSTMYNKMYLVKINGTSKVTPIIS